MGTLVRITVYTPDEAAAGTAFRAAFGRIRDLDRILSDYHPDSELNRLVKSAVGRAGPASGDLFKVLQASQQLAAETGGAFDVTQGPIIRLWREARRTKRVPDAGARREAALRGGFRKLQLDPARRTVRLEQHGMALDLGAIGKGYAASQAIAVLNRLGVHSALVAVSGDLAFSKAPPGQRGWRVGIDAVAGAPGDLPRVLELTDAAVSTAGSSEQYVEIDGRRYSHIIDPASGMGLAEDVTVTVVAPDGLQADGLDTAVSALGVTRGLALVESRPDAAAIIVQRGAAGTRVVASSRFRALARTHGADSRTPQ